MDDAADEIEELRRVKSQVDRYIALLNGEIADNGKLRDEVEPLREEVERLRAEISTTMVERLRGALLTDDDLYRLFIIVDDLARMARGRNAEINTLREKLLPVYRDWHAANPHKIHPSAQTSGSHTEGER